MVRRFWRRWLYIDFGFTALEDGVMGFMRKIEMGDVNEFMTFVNEVSWV